MHIKNIQSIGTPIFKNLNIENTQPQEDFDRILEKKAEKTAYILLSLSGLATLGFAGAVLLHDKKFGLKNFNTTLCNKGITFNNDLATLNGEKFSGKIKYLTQNKLVKIRYYNEGLLTRLDTLREHCHSTRLEILRDNNGKIKSYTLKRLNLWHSSKILHNRNVLQR